MHPAVLQIFGVQHLFPTAGAGPLLDAKCGRVPCFATAPVGNHQLLQLCFFWGRKELYMPSKAGFFVFSYYCWNQTCFLCKNHQQSQCAPGRGAWRDPMPAKHSSEEPFASWGCLEHCLAGCPHFHSRRAPSLCFGCWLLCCKSCVGVAQKAYLPLLG